MFWDLRFCDVDSAVRVTSPPSHIKFLVRGKTSPDFSHLLMMLASQEDCGLQFEQASAESPPQALPQ